MSEPVTNASSKIRAFMPLFLLLACLAVINVFDYLTSSAPIAQTIPTTLPTVLLLQTSLPSATPLLIIPSSTPPPPTPSPVPPTIPLETAVSLLGPPPNSFFYDDTTITFYWLWPLPLTDNQQLTLYIMVDGTEQQFGSLDSPNLGEAYRLTINLADVAETADSIQWQVRLQNNTAILTQSEWRTLNLVNSNE